MGGERRRTPPGRHASSRAREIDTRFASSAEGPYEGRTVLVSPQKVSGREARGLRPPALPAEVYRDKEIKEGVWQVSVCCGMRYADTCRISMNAQQGEPFPWPSQFVYHDLSYSQLRREQRLLFVGAALCLLFAFLLAAWGDTATRVPSRLQSTLPTSIVTSIPQSTLPTSVVTPSPQSSTPTSVVTPSLQSSAIAAQLDSLLTTWVGGGRFSGSVLIARDDEVLFSRGYGMADWRQHVPNTPHTKFHVGSLTKEFTAVAILLLQKQGKLHIEDHLCSYIPRCPQAWQPVTIYQVLTHSSGIPELFGSLASPQQWLAGYNGMPLAFRPGAQFSYCNVCYQILGYLIQVVSGQPYTLFLQHTIFEHLQMKNTGFDAHYPSLPEHATGYIHWKVEAVPVDWSLPLSMSFLLAAGLLYSTNEDMFLWDEALFSMHMLVPQESLDKMFVADSVSSSHQYGWFVKQSPSHTRVIWHYGIVDGFRAYDEEYPDDKVTIIILSNLDTLDVPTFVNALEKVVFTT